MNQQDQTTDVLIIGGGIIGLSIALRVRQKGLSVIVLDKQQPGQEASFAAAGLIAPKFEPATAPFARMAIASRDSYAAFCQELKEISGIDPEYRDEGTVMPLLDESEESFADEIVSSAGDSVPLKMLTAAEVKEMEPHLSPDVRRGIYIPGDHQVSNRKLMQSLIKAVEMLGVAIHAGNAAREIQTPDGKIGHVRTDSGDFTAGRVVLAAGCWSHQVEINESSLRPPTRPVKGQMAAVQMERPVHLTHNIHSPRCYLVPRLDGRVEIGSTVEEVGFDKRVTAWAVEKLLRSAISVMPALRDCAVVETWAGLRPGSPDQHPIVGKTPIEGLLMATGNYRSGLLMAPITGKLMTELILSDETPELLKPFSPARFAADAIEGG